MSFSRQVKEELIAGISSSRHCRLAELSAIVTMSGEIKDGEWKADLDNEYINSKQFKLMKLLDIDVNTEEGRKALKIKYSDNHYVTDQVLLERACCKQAYLRGAFLACGSLTNPEKGYHFEIVLNYAEHAALIMSLFESFGIEAKKILRKRYYVVYIKDASMIVDALNIIGAYKALMKMENIRIFKDMRNTVNRRVNCEAANITKTVNAACRQLEDITYISETAGLKILPANLRQIAELRLDEPETSLKELGEKLDPTLGKSGVNHRLKKISDIANELRNRPM